MHDTKYLSHDHVTTGDRYMLSSFSEVPHENSVKWLQCKSGGKECVFVPTIENESLHQKSNYFVIRTVNSAASKNLVVKEHDGSALKHS